MNTPEITSENTRKRGLLVLVILMVGLPLSGFVYEKVMAGGDDGRFPPPGQLINVEGRQMYIHCVGEGSPTVILEAGLGAWSDAWASVQPEIGKLTRVCSYDRAGMGWSASSDQPRTQDEIALELHALLAAAGIQPPYILVGHSLGGKSIRLFTEHYPDEVVGLVFVDARHESVEPPEGTPEQNAADRAAFDSSLNFYRILRNTGLARAFGVPLAHIADPSTKVLPDDVVYRLAMFGVREMTLQTQTAESAEKTANDEQLRSAQLPPNLPVYVLTADSSLQQIPNWEVGQKNLAALSSNSQWQIVPNSGHNIHAEHPQVVIDAVRAVLEAARSGQPLKPEGAS